MHIVSYFALYELLHFFDDGWAPWNEPDGQGATPIHWAARNEAKPRNEGKSQSNDVKTVEWLIKKKGNKDAKDNEHRTPLFYASQCGNLSVVSLLIEREANLNAQSKSGETALIVACTMHFDHGIIAKLVEANADVTHQGSLGTALHAISQAGCHACTKKILEKYEVATIEQNTGPFGTPLHAAAFHGHFDVVEFLIDSKRFRINTTHKVFGTVLTAAVAGYSFSSKAEDYYRITKKLIHENININDSSGKYGPALRSALTHGDRKLVEILFNAGAKISWLKDLSNLEILKTAIVSDTEDLQMLSMELESNEAASSSGTVPDILRNARLALFGYALARSKESYIEDLIHSAEKLCEARCDKKVISDKKGMQNSLFFLTTTAILGCASFHDVIQLATKQRESMRTGQNTGGMERIREYEGEEGFGAVETPNESATGNRMSERLLFTDTLQNPQPVAEGEGLLVAEEEERSPTAEKETRNDVDDGGARRNSSHTHPFTSIPRQMSADANNQYRPNQSQTNEEIRSVWQDWHRMFPCCLHLLQLFSDKTVDDTQSEIQPCPELIAMTEVTGVSTPTLESQTQMQPAPPESTIIPTASTHTLRSIRQMQPSSDPIAIARASFEAIRRPSLSLARRASSILMSDSIPKILEVGLGARYSAVLDRLTQAAVNILEYAISSGDDGIISLISENWIDALNNLISYPEFGEPMLAKVVNSRMKDFGQYLSAESTLGQEENEGYRKAESLAQVGVELLLAAARGGEKTKALSVLLSKLWAQAVHNVIDLETKNQNQIRELVRTFGKRFSIAVERANKPEVSIIASAGIEVLKAAAMGSGKTLMNQLIPEWVAHWNEANSMEMGGVIEGLIEGRQREYDDHMANERYDDALGLAVAGLGLLRAAIEKKFDKVVQVLNSVIFPEFGVKEPDNTASGSDTPENDDNPTRKSGLRRGLDLKSLVDAIVPLIVECEAVYPGRLDPLALDILRRMEGTEIQQDLQSILGQYSKNSQGDGSPSLDNGLQWTHILQVISYLQKVALDEKMESQRIFLGQLGAEN